MVKAGTVKIAPDRWYHVALVYDEKSKKLMSYIDGKEDAKIDAPGGIEQRGGPLTLGDYNNRPLKGRLDEVKIWNNALSPAEIETDMKGKVAVDSRGKLATLWGQIKTTEQR